VGRDVTIGKKLLNSVTFLEHNTRSCGSGMNVRKDDIKTLFTRARGKVRGRVLHVDNKQVVDPGKSPKDL